MSLGDCLQSSHWFVICWSFKKVIDAETIAIFRPVSFDLVIRAETIAISKIRVH